MKLLTSILVALLLVGCATTQVSPRQQFSKSCSTVGEAMIQVIQLRRAGKLDAATYRQIDDLYDAAVRTCETRPLTDDEAAVALLKLNEFFSHASGVTGVNYGTY